MQPVEDIISEAKVAYDMSMRLMKTFVIPMMFYMLDENVDVSEGISIRVSKKAKGNNRAHL